MSARRLPRAHAVAALAGIEILHRPVRRPRALPPLLFVHGAYMGAWCWDVHVMPALAARGFDCHAVSLRGHGESIGARDLDRFGLADYVDDVAYAVGRMARVPIVIGHSMGAVVAQHYARRHRVAGVVMIAGVPPLGLVAASIELGLRAPDLYTQFALIQSGQHHLIDSRRLSRAVFADDMPLPQALTYFGRMQRESRRVFAELAWPHMCSVRLAPDTPVAVLGGAQDRLFSVPGVRAAALWHGTQAQILPGLGHTLMLDRDWERAVAWLADWITATFDGNRQPRSGDV